MTIRVAKENLHEGKKWFSDGIIFFRNHLNIK
ncbi:hypothetical protein CBR77_003120 [Escherichia albertii]|nr:hypothetical protein [Escherichia albertii]EFF1429490.1 hypothetical protein [Escherichia albertii]EFL5786865.1 hypothetical protein [Escherichia albertii]EFL5796386.1 hypothetical protein [Escherichia albertii]